MWNFHTNVDLWNQSRGSAVIVLSDFLVLTGDVGRIFFLKKGRDDAWRPKKKRFNSAGSQKAGRVSCETDEGKLTKTKESPNKRLTEPSCVKVGLLAKITENGAFDKVKKLAKKSKPPWCWWQDGCLEWRQLNCLSCAQKQQLTVYRQTRLECLERENQSCCRVDDNKQKQFGGWGGECQGHFRVFKHFFVNTKDILLNRFSLKNMVDVLMSSMNAKPPKTSKTN